MDLAELLEKIQKKPLHTRKVIMYSAVAVIMSFVLLLWITTISTTVDRVTRKANEQPQESTESFEARASFSEIIHDARTSIQEQFRDARNALQGNPKPTALEQLREDVAQPNKLDFKLNSQELPLSN